MPSHHYPFHGHPISQPCGLHDAKVGKKKKKKSNLNLQRIPQRWSQMREAAWKLDRRFQRSQAAHLPDGSIYKQLGGCTLQKFLKELMKLLSLQENLFKSCYILGLCVRVFCVPAFCFRELRQITDPVQSVSWATSKTFLHLLILSVSQQSHLHTTLSGLCFLLFVYLINWLLSGWLSLCSCYFAEPRRRSWWCLSLWKSRRQLNPVKFKYVHFIFVWFIVLNSLHDFFYLFLL